MSKLEKVAEIEGFDDIDEMLLHFGTDSIVPGICKNKFCDYTCNVEPDQTSGWCEECAEESVKSIMILAGVI